MIPDLFKIGPFTLHSFGLMAMLGFLVPTLIMRGEFRRHRIDPDFASTVAVAAIIGGFIGARAYYLIEHWKDFLANPLSMIFSGAGLVWYGGFIGGVAAVIFVIRKNNLPILPTVDLIAPLMMLGYAFGRGGCFLSGDGDYGPPSDLPWAMAFPKGIVPTEVPVHPTPLYNIALTMIFFAFIWKLRTRNYPAGMIFGMCTIAGGVERFITEFWRNTPKIAFGWMSLAQMISLVLILAGAGIMNWAAKRPVESKARNIPASPTKNR
jgi:phosphatidylglycerol:prolipoprotein diacylglycerol transferase